ncbi:glycosyltransferase family 4 protein [Williamsia sp. CHRR-6]|uniref:glycosyltransferase family 4 protein n=1 Tax=Williamsia sp. CHRR-6 TaxID=2835871 RepID=UPI001BDA740A|nr:glycosyltransferase family 4 protein [Williamsia sp. CHRR-6]MBT0565475.1 glycosyltransferase family 4 protein [Williamsia sp. CHRR-6]
MRILIVSWEYPPVVVGGLGRHVHHLAVALAARADHEVVVLSRRPTGTDALTHPTDDRLVDGVRVIAVAEDPPAFDFGSDLMAWTLAMGHSMIRAGWRITDPTGVPWVPDVVHAHDWLVAHPAIALAEFYDVPLVATIHATEAGRHSGWVSGVINKQVHSVEWWLAAEADALIACSTSMHDEVSRLFGPDIAEIHTIHNGIDLSTWPFAQRRGGSQAPSLLYAGRLEYEKGIQDLIAALPRIRRDHPGTTLTIAGDGTQEQWLRELTRKHRVARAVRFVGAVGHHQLVELMHGCDAIVLPSRYEPFGIVALEAAATGAPLVTSTAGGLGEAVTDGITGLNFAPGDVAGLTAAVCGVVGDPTAAARRARQARARLTEEFSWPLVAERTAGVYLAAKRRIRHPIGRPHIIERPLPDRDLAT